MTREEMRNQGMSPAAIAMAFGGPVGTEGYYRVMKEEGADVSGKCPYCGEHCFGTGDCNCMEDREYDGFGEAIESLMWAVVVLVITAVPLALWKLVDIARYLYNHIGVSWK